MTAVPVLDADTMMMLQAREGDTASLETLLAKHRRHLVHLLYRLVQNQAVAEELAQEVFLRVYLSRHRYEASAKFATWLNRIATNRALNWLRDEKHARRSESLESVTPTGTRKQFQSGALGADSVMRREEMFAEIRGAVSALPERQRSAVVMHKYLEMDYVSIAEALSTTVPSVKSILFRAYSVLRHRLGHLDRCRA